ncbi:MAG: GyrI-like domain-containing protein [Acetanaerobacterium sp.]
MPQKLDYKKEYKELYLPPVHPVLVSIPRMQFLMVDGRGDPNVQGGEYQQALELLYALTFTIKMSKMSARQLPGYFEYVVPPLEGLWWLDDGTSIDFTQKERFCFSSMIRQPDFVTPEVVAWACEQASKKKPHLDYGKARLADLEEGLCVQMMHIGPYDDEPSSLARMESFVAEQGHISDVGTTLPDGFIRRHHEIYLGDPRKTSPERLKTVLRSPVKQG